MTERMRVILPDDVKRAIWLRQLVMFLFVVAFALSSSYWQSRQTDGLKRAQRAEFSMCQGIQALVTQTVDNVNVSKGLTAEQKVDALTSYTALLKKLKCEDIAP